MSRAPTAEQAAAIASTAPAIALKAAPGSGKTFTLVGRVVRLIEDGYSPAEILVVTFTRKAAEEVRERIAAALDGKRVRGLRKMYVGTFHGLAARLLRTYADRLGLDPRFTIRDEADKADLVIYVAEELGLLKGKPPVTTADGRLKRARSLEGKDGVQRRYQQLLKEAQAVDYDGLERILLDLLRIKDAHGNSEVGGHLRQRWKHVLVDEFQDTSGGQQAVIDAIGPDNLCVVGDIAQSIYAFRGAHPTGFVGFAQREGVTPMELSVNWRSHPGIVAGATRVGRAMAMRGLEQTAGRQVPGERLGLLEMPLTPGIDTWAPLVIEDIMQRAGELGMNEDGLPCWSSLAILSPTWRELERLVPKLTEAGIPCRLGKRRVTPWQSEGMRWLLDGLRFVANPSDHLALHSLLNRVSVRVPMGPWAGLRAAQLGGSGGLLDAAPAVVRGHAVQLLNGVRLAMSRDDEESRGVARCVALSIEMVLAAEHLPNKVDELKDALVTIEAWAAAQPEGESTVRHLLDSLSDDLVSLDAEASEPEGITLSTIHGAKGLEWRHVWVLGCETKVMPRSTTPGTSYEEALRLFYVAFTRAQDSASLCWRANRDRSPFIPLAIGDDDGAPS
jgi:DNA helicase II / ATP-dependent DNA helicase PcrA